MNRGKKAAYNSIASLFAEGITIICGFIVPRMILSSFGSAYNGLVQSVAQFLSIVSLLRAGVGGATRAALYKSLAKQDVYQISATIRATELFMRKVAYIFAAFVLCFSCIYPFFIQNDFDWLFSASLVLIISISTFVEYYFGITYIILLQADQRQYIVSILSMVATVLNTLLSILFIRLGMGIHAVKLGSAAAYCVTPITLNLYAKKHYSIDKTVKPDYSSINQRWDALFHQVAGFIYNNTDIMLITLFINLREVSVYTTYGLVSYGLKKLMTTVTTGVEAAFGDMIVRDDQIVLRKNVQIYETLLHGAVCVVFGSALVLITPFIMIYTKGVNDINYSRSTFAYLLMITEAIYLLRQPYHSIAEAAGHFKQTKYIAIVQSALNLCLSIILVNIYGLIGVIIGTLVSDAYRSIAYRQYVKRNILQGIKTYEYIKRCLVTAFTFSLIYLFPMILPEMNIDSYQAWILYAVLITSFALLVTTGLSLVFYRHETLTLFRKLIVISRSIISREQNDSMH